MNKLKSKFGKKQAPSRLVESTKDFVKGYGDDGLQSLPYILESCSSAAEFSLTSQIEVLDLIAKYYAQNTQLRRQLRCIDLLRYLSDQHDNELFHLLDQGHPILKTVDMNLRHTRVQPALQKGTRTLLDHLVRQPNVPIAIIELHAKHVNGFSSPHKPTIILSDQEVVADDIEAASAEAELLATLLTDSSSDTALLKEVYTRIRNTRERLVRDIDTSTNEAQTVNLITSVENIDQVILLYKEMHPSKEGAGRRSSTATNNSGYNAPSRILDGERHSTESGRSRGRRNGKSKATSPESSPPRDYNFTGNHIYHEDQFSSSGGEGSSSANTRGFGQTIASSFSSTQDDAFVPPSTPHHDSNNSTDVHRLSSNNPFALKGPENLSLSPSNPYARKPERSASTSKNPFTTPTGDAPEEHFDALRI